MGGMNSGRKTMSAKELEARHKRFAAALELYRSVPLAAQCCGLSRQWGYEIAKRLGWERGGWGWVTTREEKEAWGWGNVDPKRLA